MIDAQDFLDAALAMMAGQREIDYRNAASRAYYCAYHVCRALLERMPNPNKSTAATHERVVMDLQTHPDRRLKKLGNKLNQAKALRRQADYALDADFSHTNAKQAIGHAQKIAAEVKAL